MEEEKRELTVREAGRRGGLRLKAKYGVDHFRAMGKAGGDSNVRRHEREHFVQIGRKGGAVARTGQLARDEG